MNLSNINNPKIKKEYLMIALPVIISISVVAVKIILSGNVTAINAFKPDSFIKKF